VRRWQPPPRAQCVASPPRHVPCAPPSCDRDSAPWTTSTPTLRGGADTPPAPREETLGSPRWSAAQNPRDCPPCGRKIAAEMSNRCASRHAEAREAVCRTSLRPEKRATLKMNMPARPAHSFFARHSLRSQTCSSYAWCWDHAPPNDSHSGTTGSTTSPLPSVPSADGCPSRPRTVEEHRTRRTGESRGALQNPPGDYGPPRRWRRRLVAVHARGGAKAWGSRRRPGH